jgi:hypothetical protein
MSKNGVTLIVLTMFLKLCTATTENEQKLIERGIEVLSSSNFNEKINGEQEGQSSKSKDRSDRMVLFFEEKCP